MKTYFSLSPSHLDMRSEEDTEKKVELLASVATALARYDFPVPGGPNSRMPLHGVRFPGNAERRSTVRFQRTIMSECEGEFEQGTSHSTCEEVREFDGQDDGFLQSFFSSLQSGHIVPPHVGLLHHNGTCTHRHSMVKSDDADRRNSIKVTPKVVLA